MKDSAQLHNTPCSRGCTRQNVSPLQEFPVHALVLTSIKGLHSNMCIIMLHKTLVVPASQPAEGYPIQDIACVTSVTKALPSLHMVSQVCSSGFSTGTMIHTASALMICRQVGCRYCSRRILCWATRQRLWVWYWLIPCKDHCPCT